MSELEDPEPRPREVFVPVPSEGEDAAQNEAGDQVDAAPEHEASGGVYVRNEAPWSGVAAAGPIPRAVTGGPGPSAAEDQEITVMVRRRRVGRLAVAWAVTGAAVVVVAWTLPFLLAPTTNLGRIASFAAMVIGGFGLLFAVTRTWAWAQGRT